MASSIPLSFPASADILAVAANYRLNKLTSVRDKFIDLQQGAGGTLAETGTTATTTQADEVWVACFSARGSLGHSPINSFVEQEYVTDGDARSASIADKIVSSTGTANSRVTISTPGEKSNQNACITFKAATPGVPIERVQYASAHTGGTPATSLEVPWDEDPELNDLLCLWLMIDYGSPLASPGSRPTFLDASPTWTRQIEMSIDNQYHSYFYYALAPEPPEPPPAVIGGAPGFLEAVGTPGHIIIGPTGESL